MEATGKDLIEFWAWAADRGEMNTNTAAALRSACRDVLTTVEPDTWETLDLRTLDVESACKRFANKKAGTSSKPDSLRRYQLRFKRAVASFLAYLDAPDKWHFEIDRPQPQPRSGNGESRRAKTSTTKAERNGAGSAGAAEVMMLDHHFVVRPRERLVVTLTLPFDLTKHEAKRLSDFLYSLAFDPALALPAPADADVDGA